ncbi:MAG: aminoacyl-tRNA hydrolase [Acidimicrobiia bacterium]|nr:aminoacyl-tRNA hydrolase [Acidimicrobiia bacterium]
MIGRRRSTERRGPAPDLLVVGLGNPGAEYEGTRHNIGFEVVDLLARRHHGSWRTSRQRAEVCEVQTEAGRIVLAKPQTFMNVSGESVKALLRHFGLGPAEMLVAHDELDLPFAHVRIKSGGGTAGHNGLKSVVACIGTRDFARLRVGVGRPPGRMPGADFVLKRFRSDETDDAAVAVAVAADMAESWAAVGVDATQNRFHGA